MIYGCLTFMCNYCHFIIISFMMINFPFSGVAFVNLKTREIKISFNVGGGGGGGGSLSKYGVHQIICIIINVFCRGIF